MGEQHPSFDICILCALYEEASAVIDEFTLQFGVSFTKAFHSLNQREYRSTTIQNRRGERLTLFVTWLGEMGPIRAALDLKPLLQEINPPFVAMTGVCAGDRNRVQLGDLIVAAGAYHPEEGKITTDTNEQPFHLPEIRTINATPLVMQYVQGFSEWHEPLHELKRRRLMNAWKTSDESECHIGVIASSMAVRADNPFPKWITQHHRKTIGADMEAATFYTALHDFPRLHGLVVKGVSDFGDSSKNDEWRNYAARASAVYILHFIQEYVTEETMPRGKAEPLSAFTVRMQRDQPPGTSSHQLPSWLVRFCHTLWKIEIWVNGSVILALILGVAAVPLTSSKGNIPADSPVRWLLAHWPLIALMVFCLILITFLTWLMSRWYIPATQLSARDRAHMLGRLRIRYEQILVQSLQGVEQVELRLASRPTAVQNTVSLSLWLAGSIDQLLPPHTTIVQAYELAQHELLILGEPGAGKSAQLLALARHLVAQAEQDETRPLPIILSLSSWATKRSTLQDWLIEQVSQLYNVSRRWSQQWIQADAILPLLDGLDEVKEVVRAECIEAINIYHREHLHPLVVCSRTDGYDRAVARERLALHTAVVVQPLLAEQVDAYLERQGESRAALRTALRKDAKLRDLATTPLFLHILMQTYYGTPVRALSQKGIYLQQQIWTDYVQHMLHHSGANEPYSFKQTLSWLSWLATQLIRSNQTEFYLERMQPAWLKKQWHYRIYCVVGKLTVGLLSGLAGGFAVNQFGQLSDPLFGTIVSGVIAGVIGGSVAKLRSLHGFPRHLHLSLAILLTYGTVGGLIGGLFHWLSRGWSWEIPTVGFFVAMFWAILEWSISEIQPLEIPSWSWKSIQHKLGAMIAVGLLIGVIEGLANNLLAGLLFGMIGALYVGVCSGLSSGTFLQELPNTPNEGIRRSARSCLVTGLIGGIVGGSTASILLGWEGGLAMGVGWAIGIGLFNGGDQCIKHVLLRFFLWRERSLPWHYSQFLDYASERILLRKVAGGYIFTHRLLMEYFATLGSATL